MKADERAAVLEMAAILAAKEEVARGARKVDAMGSRKASIQIAKEAAASAAAAHEAAAWWKRKAERDATNLNRAREALQNAHMKLNRAQEQGASLEPANLEASANHKRMVRVRAANLAEAVKNMKAAMESDQASREAAKKAEAQYLSKMAEYVAAVAD